MPQEILRQVKFTNGELSPELLARRDFKGFYGGLAMGQNTLFEPQGPLVRRPGFAFIDLVRETLDLLDLTGVTATAAHGGVTSDAVDPSHGAAMVTTANLGTEDPYVVLTIDFGEPTTVAAVDLVDYAVVDAAAPVVPAPAPIPYPWPNFGGGAVFY